MHFTEIASSTALPIILYNVPGRTVINIEDDTIVRIVSKCKNVVGIKDATGDLARVPNLRSKIGNDFILLSGEDVTALAFNVSGGDGIISVTSNVYPKLCKALQDSTLSKFNLKNALEIQNQLTDLHNTLFSEVNPIPVKYAMHLLGFCELEYRLPLCNPSQKTQEKVKNKLASLGFSIP